MKRLITILVLLQWAIACIGQAYESDIYFSHLDNTNGLSSNEITCIFKDSRGFMWFGTVSHINRYDANSFKTFQHRENGAPFSEETVFRMSETKDGLLWITYKDQQISVFSPEKNTFHTASEIARSLNISQEIYQVFPAIDNNLLFTDKQGNVYLYSYFAKTVTTLKNNQEQCPVSAIAIYESEMYLLYSNGLLECVNLNRFETLFKTEYLHQQHPDLTTGWNVYIDRDGELWIYQDAPNYWGVYLYSPQENTWRKFDTQSKVKLSSNMVRGIEQSSNGIIWIATDHGGLNLYDKRTEKITCLRNNPFVKGSISQNSIISIYKDNEEIIWLGTYKKGVDYHHKNLFKFKRLLYPLSADSGIEENDCTCILQDSPQQLWIGTNGGGLLCYNRLTQEYKRYVHNPQNPGSLSSNIIVYMIKDKKGRLWIGTYMGGLVCFDGQFHTFSPRKIKKGHNELTSITSMEYDGDNSLWIGTLEDGFYHFDIDTKTWEEKHIVYGKDSLYQKKVNAIALGGQHELFVSTSQGINIFNTATQKVQMLNEEFSQGHAINETYFYTIYVDSNNRLWMGGNNGIYICNRNTGELLRFDTDNGLPDNHISIFREDLKGYMWIGTKNGLTKAKLETIQDKTGCNFQNYMQEDGLPSATFNRNAGSTDKDGNFIFGTTNGLAIFTPHEIDLRQNSPKIMITDLRVQNQIISPNTPYDGKPIIASDISYSPQINLNYGQHNLALSLAILDYLHPQKNSISYKMEGLDSQWNEIASNHQLVTYTNLNPGDYVFMAKASNPNNGQTSETIQIPIHIAPPFYSSIYAYVLYIILLLVILYLILRYILNIQNKRFRYEKEKMVSRQQHDMDEMKLRFFTNISHEFRTPLSLIILPVERLLKTEQNAELRMSYQLIRQNAQQLLDLVNQVLDFRKIDKKKHQLILSSGDIVLFVNDIVRSFRQLSEEKEISFSFSSSTPSFIIKFDADKVRKILTNLLNNAFKFTPEKGKITVKLFPIQRKEQLQLCIEVSDTGIGILPEDQKHIFDRFYQANDDSRGTGIGLHLCHEFAEIHHGEITVDSTYGQGSTFAFYFPIETNEYQETIHDVEEESIAIPPTELPNESEPEEKANAQKPTILLVDDNKDFREYISLCLKETYNVITQPNGQEAWECILKTFPDIVITDIMMPVMDGISLCRLIKGDVRTSHIPVILLTAKTGQENEYTGLQAGADDYICKPFNIDVLSLKIKHIAEQQAQIQQKLMKSSRTSIQLADAPISSLDEELIRKAIAYIEQERSNPLLSVELLSKQMCMSRTNFYKKSLSLTGKTPLELIRSVRLRYAAQLLEKTQLRINEIAMEIGMNDIKAFRKYFKEEFGMLPSEYERNSNKPSITQTSPE